MLKIYYFYSTKMINVTHILMNGFGSSQEESHGRCVYVNVEVLALPKIHHLLTLKSTRLACFWGRQKMIYCRMPRVSHNKTGTVKLKKKSIITYATVYVTDVNVNVLFFIFFPSNLPQSINFSMKKYLYFSLSSTQIYCTTGNIMHVIWIAFWYFYDAFGHFGDLTAPLPV